MEKRLGRYIRYNFLPPSLFKSLTKVRMPGTVTDEEDQYLCTGRKMRSTSWAVGFEPLSSSDIAHHMLVYICDEAGQVNLVIVNLRGKWFLQAAVTSFGLAVTTFPRRSPTSSTRALAETIRSSSGLGLWTRKVSSCRRMRESRRVVSKATFNLTRSAVEIWPNGRRASALRARNHRGRPQRRLRQVVFRGQGERRGSHVPGPKWRHSFAFDGFTKLPDAFRAPE